MAGEWHAHGDVMSERLSFSSDGQAVVRIRGDGLQIHPVSGRGTIDVPTAAVS